MTPARRFGLAHLTIPVFAALPCVHTRMGDTALTFTIYSFFTNPQYPLTTRQAAPWAVFALMIGLGASFAFRSTELRKARTVAIVVTALALFAFLDQTLAVLKGYTQATVFFLPPIEFRAGVGLWCMLGAQAIALWQAVQFPLAAKPTDR